MQEAKVNIAKNKDTINTIKYCILSFCSKFLFNQLLILPSSAKEACSRFRTLESIKIEGATIFKKRDLLHPYTISIKLISFFYYQHMVYLLDLHFPEFLNSCK